MSTEQLAILCARVVSAVDGAPRQASGADAESHRSCIAVLRQAITAHQGVEIDAQADGVTATFVSASSALACAVSMQQGVERAQRDRSLRVGVSAGEVTLQRGARAGECMTEAAGLCAACENGQVRRLTSCV